MDGKQIIISVAIICGTILGHSGIGYFKEKNKLLLVQKLRSIDADEKIRIIEALSCPHSPKRFHCKIKV